jgi:hypothetical protein
MPDDDNTVRGKRKREHIVAALLVICVVIVAFWEIMSMRSRRPFQPFELTAADFSDFWPSSDTWSIESLPVGSDPIEPNILVYHLHRKAPQADSDTPIPRHPAISVAVRLVHGYNMPDCMRIKHFNCELLNDARRLVEGKRSELSTMALAQEDPATLPYADTPVPRHQVWRLTSPGGERSMWITSMLRVGDFTATGIDTRSMAFPRIGITDNPGWFPRGLSFRSLRYPVKNFRLFLRSQWNSSRSDLLTFLKLKQPAWASDELLTLVTLSLGPSVTPEGERPVTREILAAHAFMHTQLRAWRLKKIGEPPSTSKSKAE